MQIADLQHVTRSLPNGGLVLVLKTGALIDPEAEAMIQALHSRSVGGVYAHLQKLAEKGAANFMASFYVGYGHRSIGDCGSVTIFIEGVSMLVAKAIQDNPLYSGQEASTRYIDFSVQPFVDPLQTTASQKVLQTWRSFYLDAMPAVVDHLKQQFPKEAQEKQTVYEKAIAARAFDILRGFLPAGAATNLAWHTNLRQAADHLMILRHHPLSEVRDVANAIESALYEAYPSSFGHKQYIATESYNETWMQKMYFEHESFNGVELLADNIDRELLLSYTNFLSARPSKTDLPKIIAECGTMQFGFMLDFGSFRDLQRHRAVTQRMPLVTYRHGFNPFYLASMPLDWQNKAKALLTEQEALIASLTPDKAIQQYYVAMGYNLPNRLTGNLAALVYLVELRATRFVHPTLQVVATEMAKILQKRLENAGLVLHLDSDPGRFDIKRGLHDIVSKDGDNL